MLKRVYSVHLLSRDFLDNDVVKRWRGEYAIVPKKGSGCCDSVTLRAPKAPRNTINTTTRNISGSMSSQRRCTTDTPSTETVRARLCTEASTGCATPGTGTARQTCERCQTTVLLNSDPQKKKLLHPKSIPTSQCYNCTLIFNNFEMFRRKIFELKPQTGGVNA